MKLLGGSKTSKSTSASSRLIQNNLAMRHQLGQDADQAMHVTTATATASRESRTSISSSSDAGSDVTDDDEEVQRAVREAERLSALVAPPPVRAPVRSVKRNERDLL